MATWQKTIFGLLAILWVLSGSPAAASDPAEEPVKEPAKTSAEKPAPEESRVLSTKSVTYQSVDGSFEVVFPSGCGKLLTRANEPDLYGGQEWDDIIQVTHVYCDRYQTEGEGCSVTATFNLHDEDGGPAGPEHVITRVQESLGVFGVEIVSQQALNKDFGDGYYAEGVEARAKSIDGKGEVWIRGLLILGDIYILQAWNVEGGVWNNQDYLMFFNSFQPWAE